MAVPTREQRERERARVWLPLRVLWDRGDTLAVTYDASDKGVLMLTAKLLAVGERVSVTFEVPGEVACERTGTGRVVRAEPNGDDPHGLWPYRVAVALDEAMEAFAAELNRLSRAHPLV
jgi:hypothetical protein